MDRTSILTSSSRRDSGIGHSPLSSAADELYINSPEIVHLKEESGGWRILHVTMATRSARRRGATSRGETDADGTG